MKITVLLCVAITILFQCVHAAEEECAIVCPTTGVTASSPCTATTIGNCYCKPTSGNDDTVVLVCYNDTWEQVVIDTTTTTKVIVPTFGGCVNREIHGTEIPPGKTPGFHCHFDSSECDENEEWLTPSQMQDENGIDACTCNHEMDENTFVKTCYDVEETHTLTCATHGECPPKWMDLGNRFNSGNTIPEECTHGSNAYGSYQGFVGVSCGKRCTCNYHYTSLTSKVKAASTNYGLCRKTNNHNDNYCAINNTTCAENEEFRKYWEIRPKVCTCLHTPTGACIDVKPFDNSVAFSHCAVKGDSCQEEQVYLTAREFMSSKSLFNVECNLCKDTWNTPPPTDSPIGGPTESPTTSPSDPPTEVPTDVPSNTPTNPPSDLPSNDPTVVPTSMPSDVPSSFPTDQPSSFPTTSPPTVSLSPTTVPSSSPSATPTAEPSSQPSAAPSLSDQPSISDYPTTVPSAAPTSEPSTVPTTVPTAEPSTVPTSVPSATPTTGAPTLSPSGAPSSAPTSIPSGVPTKTPSMTPTSVPTTPSPTSEPTVPHCTDPGSNCYKAHNSPGCGDKKCQKQVCDLQPKCCTKANNFIGSCVNLAIYLCDNCPCDEKPFRRFLQSVQYGMGPPIFIYKNCAWLKNASAPVRREICNKFSVARGDPARVICPITCSVPVC